MNLRNIALFAIILAGVACQAPAPSQQPGVAQRGVRFAEEVEERDTDDFVANRLRKKEATNLLNPFNRK